MLTYSEIAENIQKVALTIASLKDNENITREITVLGATKTMPKDIVDFVLDNNLLRDVGENRVQELLDKYDASKKANWHLIGALQTNKVKYIIDKVDLIHSLDSARLAEEIQKQAKKIGKTVSCLIQLNLGREENKSGLFLEEVENFVEKMRDYDHIAIKGLMGVTPICEAEDSIKYFTALKDTFYKIKEKNPELDFRYISAGMSNDYCLAIKYAEANIVRLGSNIFGRRNLNV